MTDESRPKAAPESFGGDDLIVPRPPLVWRQRRDRRRACNGLNALLGRPTRPDLDVTCPRITLREST